MARRKAPPASTTPAGATDASPWLLATALWLAVLAAYQPAWHGAPLWDDDKHLTAAALQTVDGLRRIWLEPGATQQYYPVTHSAFWIMHRLWGDATLGYHLVNITLHALSALIVFGILRRLAIPGATLAAFVFALHPVHVESVAWMTEMKNTLSGALYLGAAWLYLDFERDRRRGAYIAALALFALALLAKSVTATLPLALLVVFWWRRGAISWPRDVRPLLPFVAAGVAAGIWTSWVEHSLIGAQGEEFAFGIVERLLIAGRALWFYLVTLLWPVDLVFSYPRWQIDAGNWQQFLYPLTAVTVCVVLWLTRRRSRAPLAAALVFIITVAPALGFVNVYPFRFSFVADHFAYLASLGIIVGVAAGLTSATIRSRLAPAMRVGFAAALVVTLGVLTWRESREYVDAATLYRAVLERNPESWLALTNLGKLQLEGDPSKARELFERALQLKPDLPEARNNLGNALQRLGRHAEALPHYREAVRLAPDHAMYHNSLASALRFTGRLDESAQESARALSQDPSYAEAHYNLGAVRQAQGRAEEAVAAYREVIRLNPRFGVAYHGLGQALFGLGRSEEAASALRTAATILSGAPVVHNDLGAVLSSLGRNDEAIAAFARAIQLRGDYGDAYFNLGRTLQRAGRADDAVEAYQRAVAIRPGDAAAHTNLGAALEATGRRQEAAQHFAEAVRLDPSSEAARANLARIRR